MSTYAWQPIKRLVALTQFKEQLNGCKQIPRDALPLPGRSLNPRIHLHKSENTNRLFLPDFQRAQFAFPPNSMDLSGNYEQSERNVSAKRGVSQESSLAHSKATGESA